MSDIAMGVPVWDTEYQKLMASLAPQQRAAVDLLCHPDAPVVELLAGAGSGKTRIFIAAIATMIRMGITPSQLIVTTFTVKAREEVSKRLAQVVSPMALRDLRLGTFNSLAMRFAKANAGKIAAHDALFRHEFDSNAKIDGRNTLGPVFGGKSTSFGLDTLAQRVWGAPRKRRGELQHIPGLEKERFYGLSLGGDPSASDPALKAPRTENSAREYLTHVNLIRQRALRYDDEPAQLYARVLAGDPEAAEVVRGYDFNDPLQASWWTYLLQHAGNFPDFDRFWYYVNLAKVNLNAWDFLDTLWVYWKYNRETAKRVLVDEAQDSSFMQLTTALGIAKRSGGTLEIGGDVRQCIPEGEPVWLGKGESSLPVETVAAAPGAWIASAVGGKLSSHEVSAVQRSEHTTAFEFDLEGGGGFRVTPEHACWAALGQPIGYYVYLMYREGYGFRIGATQASGTLGLKHLIVRTQQEKAQRLWILATAADSAEAHRMEHALAYRFQVPMAPFKPRPGTMFDTPDEAEAFFAEFQSNGFRVLKAFRQEFEHPVYVAKSSKRGCVAVNLILGCEKPHGAVAKVEVESENIPSTVQAAFRFTPSQGNCTRLRYERRGAAEAIAKAQEVCAALNAAGTPAHIAHTLSLPHSDRRVFCVPAAGVFPGMYVPAADPDGTVRLRLVVARREVPCRVAYDMTLPATANFVVGSGKVVVHNSIFSFQGANPSFMRNAPRAFGASVAQVTTNYRSWRRQVMLGNAIAHGQDWMVGDPAMPARRKDGVLHRGVVEVHLSRELSDAAEDVAEAVANSVSLGAAYADHALLVRTHAHGDLLEMACLRRGIPLVRLGQPRSFFTGTWALKVRAYLMFYAVKDNPVDWETTRPRLALIANGEEHRKRWVPADAFGDVLEQATGATQKSPLMQGLRETLRLAETRAGSDWKAQKLPKAIQHLIDDLDHLRSLPWPKVMDWIEGTLIEEKPKPKPGTAGVLVEAKDVIATDGDIPLDDSDVPEESPAASVIQTFRGMASGRTLPEFIEFLKRVNPAAPENQGKVIRYGGSDDPAFVADYESVRRERVTLATIFVAKGLEWPKVYSIIPFGSFPNFRADYDEESRLFYVAVTRSENELHLYGTTVRDGDRPIPRSDFIDKAIDFLATDTVECELAAEPTAWGWDLAGTVDTCVADRVLTWAHGNEAVRYDLTTYRLTAIRDGQEHVLISELSLERAAYKGLGAVEITKGQTIRDYMQRHQPPAATPIPAQNPLVEQRKHAFLGWLKETRESDLLPFVDDAPIAYDTPMWTSEALTARLGWRTLEDLHRTLVRSPFPMAGLAGESRLVIETPAGQTVLWTVENPQDGSQVWHLAGAAPIDPASEGTRFGVTDSDGKTVTWDGGRNFTLPVTLFKRVVKQGDRELVGLRVLAANRAESLGLGPPSAAPAALSMTLGDLVVEADPSGPGLYRLRMLGSETLLGTSPNREVLVRDALAFEVVRRAGVDPLSPFPEVPLDGDRTFEVRRSLGEVVQVVGARSPLAAAIEVARQGQHPPRWLWYMATDAVFKDPGVTCTLPDGSTYTAVPATPTAPPAPAGPATPPVPTSPVKVIEPPKPKVARPRELADRRWINTQVELDRRSAWDLLVDVMDNRPVYELWRHLPKANIRNNTLFLRSRRTQMGNLEGLDVVRVVLDESRKSNPVTLVPVLAFEWPTRMEVYEEARLEFYGRVAGVISEYRHDALSERFGTHPVLLDTAHLVRAMYEISPEGGMKVAPNGGVLAGNGTPLSRLGAERGKQLPALVDAGYLSVVGDSPSRYGWAF